jgi:hypothetical protein
MNNARKLTDDENEYVAAFLKRMTDLDARTTEDCCYCGKHIYRMEKIGRCIYARPCGCRLWQGHIPRAWKDSIK